MSDVQVERQFKDLEHWRKPGIVLYSLILGLLLGFEVPYLIAGESPGLAWWGALACFAYFLVDLHRNPVMGYREALSAPITLRKVVALGAAPVVLVTAYFVGYDYGYSWAETENQKEQLAELLRCTPSCN